MATAKRPHARYRIVGLQPVGTCSVCSASGGYQWGGREYCARHCSEEVRVRTLMRRGVTALKQALGSDYSVQIEIVERTTGRRA